jgi:hypothetical protein
MKVFVCNSGGPLTTLPITEKEKFHFSRLREAAWTETEKE